MTRNTADFQNQILFHGTSAALKPGDVVTPQATSKDGEEGYGWAFATPDAEYAGEHGSNVYQVEVPDDAQVHPDNEDAIVSKKGFRVVKQVK
jgi:hypothetical protein